VEWLQRLVGARPGGAFDGATESALKAWQSREGLPPTGYFGPQSRRRAGPALRRALAGRGRPAAGSAAPAPGAAPPPARALLPAFPGARAAGAALLAVAAGGALARLSALSRGALRRAPREPPSLRDFVEDAKRRRRAAWGEAGPPRLEPPPPPPEVTALVFVGSQPLGLARVTAERTAGAWAQFMDVVRTVLTLRPAGTLKKGGEGAGGAAAADAPFVDLDPVDSLEERGEE